MGKAEFLDNISNTQNNSKQKALITNAVIKSCAISISKICNNNNECALYISKHIQDDIDQIIDYILASDNLSSSISDEQYMNIIITRIQKNIDKLINDKYIDYFCNMIKSIRTDHLTTKNASVLVE